jgi:hypothetical protein
MQEFWQTKRQVIFRRKITESALHIAPPPEKSINIPLAPRPHPRPTRPMQHALFALALMG